MVVKYFDTEFLKSKFSNLLGQAQVDFTEHNSNDVMPFIIRCTASGINFEGTLKKSISSQDELQEFARMIADAWKEHKSLSPKIVRAGPDELENLNELK